MISFEWDGRKDKANQAKHDVSFEEASTAFFDPLALVIADPLHSAQEERLVLIGETLAYRLIVVSHCDFGNRIRIISAREATNAEKKHYEERK